MEQNNPANKIVKTGNLRNRNSLKMFKAIADGIPKSEQLAARRRLLKKTARSRMKAGRMRYWNPDYLKDKKPGDPRLQKMSKSARNFQKLQIRNAQRILQEKVRKMAIEMSELQKNAKNTIKDGPKSKWKPLHNNNLVYKYGGVHLNEDSFRVYKAFEKMEDARLDSLKRFRRDVNLIEQKIIAQEAMDRRQIKGAFGTTVAYLVADRINEKYLDPLAKKMGTKIGRYLKRNADNLETKARSYLKSKFNGKRQQRT